MVLSGPWNGVWPRTRVTDYMDRKLLKLTLTSGSSKVFNCLGMTKARALGSGPAPDDDMIFSVRALNYGVFFKEPTDKSWTSGVDTPVDTLLYFPYDADKLTDGGVSVSLNDRRFEAVIQEFAQAFGTSGHKNANNDRAILDIFKTTPSLDPYLLKSAFQRAGIQVPDGYLKISDEEWQAIRDYVRAKLYPMITFGLSKATAANATKIEEFVDKIWDGTDVSSLFPLLEALQIDLDKAQDIIFSWKGLTFFEYIYENKTKTVRTCAAWLKDNTKPVDFVRHEAKNRLEVRRDEIRRLLRKSLQAVVGILDSYNAAYRKLFVQKAGAGDFRQFLLDCPRHYLVLGSALNRIDHATEILDRTLKGDYTRALKSDELEDVFQCLVDVLR